ncbi:MAG TPA: hypothetical protein ENN11_00720 [Methanomicrobia archaeon]|nr:hypothetical protein [Methanomicrobia archaeon]
MRRRWLIVLMVLGLFLVPMLPATADEPYTPPTISIDAPSSVTPNTNVNLKVTIVNTTGTRMWRSKVSLDINSIPSSVRQYLQFYETEYELTKYKEDMHGHDRMEPSESITKTFRVKVTNEAPAMTIPLYVTLETEVGECEEGCAPYFRTVETPIQVIRNAPSVILDLDSEGIALQAGECEIAKGSFSVNYTLTNGSDYTAFNVNVNVESPDIQLSTSITPQMPLTSMGPEDEVTGTAYMVTGHISPGTYSLTIVATYQDWYGKEFIASAPVTITVSTDAYDLYAQGERLIAACEYDAARDYLTEARDTYQEGGNVTMMHLCEELISLSYGHETLLSAQEAYYNGDYEDALAGFTAAKGHYASADDCPGKELAEEGISACNAALSGIAPIDEDEGGGMSTLELSLIVIVLVLAGLLVLSLRK